MKRRKLLACHPSSSIFFHPFSYYSLRFSCSLFFFRLLCRLLPLYRFTFTFHHSSSSNSRSFRCSFSSPPFLTLHSCATTYDRYLARLSSLYCCRMTITCQNDYPASRRHFVYLNNDPYEYNSLLKTSLALLKYGRAALLKNGRSALLKNGRAALLKNGRAGIMATTHRSTLVVITIAQYIIFKRSSGIIAISPRQGISICSKSPNRRQYEKLNISDFPSFR